MSDYEFFCQHCNRLCDVDTGVLREHGPYILVSCVYSNCQEQPEMDYRGEDVTGAILQWAKLKHEADEKLSKELGVTKLITPEEFKKDKSNDTAN